jgi:hypothetical protein
MEGSGPDEAFFVGRHPDRSNRDTAPGPGAARNGCLVRKVATSFGIPLLGSVIAPPTLLGRSPSTQSVYARLIAGSAPCAWQDRQPGRHRYRRAGAQRRPPRPRRWRGESRRQTNGRSAARTTRRHSSPTRRPSRPDGPPRARRPSRVHRRTQTRSKPPRRYIAHRTQPHLRRLTAERKTKHCSPGASNGWPAGRRVGRRFHGSHRLRLCRRRRALLSRDRARS